MSYNRYVYAQERSESDFLRNSLLKIAAEKTTPTDVFDSDFSNITTERVQYLGVSGSVSVSYSVSIGYERREEYKEWNGSKTVTKTRTVTDWHPTSGEYDSTELSAFVECGKSADRKESRCISHAIETCKTGNAVFYDEDYDGHDAPYSEVTADDFKNAEENLRAQGIMQCKSHFPGDTYKDYSGTSGVSVSKEALYIGPRHTLTYKYKGDTYTTRALSFGKYKEISNKPDATADHLKERNEKTARFGYLALLLSLVSVIMSLTVRVTALVWIGFILSALSVGLFIAARFTFEKILESRNFDIKIKGLKKAFERYGLPSVTDEEMQSLRSKGDVKK